MCFQFFIQWRMLQYQNFFKKILEDTCPFCEVTDTSVLDFCSCLPWVSKPGCTRLPMLCCLCADPQIHLWCDTCQPLDGWHGSPSHSLHAEFSLCRDGMPGFEPVISQSVHRCTTHLATMTRFQN